MLAVAVVAAFAPALGADWLLWDDEDNFVLHDAWRGLTVDHLRWMFTTFHLGPYQPLAWLSLAVDHELWGMDARGYHATNVALHALATVAFFFLARQLLDRTGATVSPRARDLCAAAAALAFGVHPLRCESVAWITERRDVVSGLFLVLAVYAWLRSTLGGNAARRWYGAAVVLYALSLLGKGLGMMLPPVMLLLDIGVLGRWRHTASAPGARSLPGLCLEKLPFALLAFAAMVLAWIGQSALSGMAGVEQHGIAARLAQAAYGLCFYVRSSLLPVDLSPLVPLPRPLDAFEPRFVVAAACVLAGASLLFALRRRFPATATAFASYVVLIAPVLGLVQTGPQLVADRYSYLACMPFPLLAAAALQAAVARWPARARLLGGATTLLLVALAAACHRQTGYWRDSIALFTRACDVDSHNPIARRNLVLTYTRLAAAATDARRADELYDAALAQCAIGIERNPDPAFLIGAAIVLDAQATRHPEHQRELLTRAVDHARRAVELSTRLGEPSVLAYRNLAVALSRLGRHAESVAVLDQFVRAAPQHPERQLMLGEALLAAGRAAEALAPLSRVVAIASDHALAWALLGVARRAVGDHAAAIEAYRRGIAIAERGPGPAGASGELRQWRQALAELERR